MNTTFQERCFDARSCADEAVAQSHEAVRLARIAGILGIVSLACWMAASILLLAF